MDFLMSILIPLIVPSLGAGLILFLIWRFLLRRHPGERQTSSPAARKVVLSATPSDKEQQNKEEQKEQENGESITARIYDSPTRTIYNGVITSEIMTQVIESCGSLGRKWYRDGKWIYCINKYQDAKSNTIYRPMEILMPDVPEASPIDLHDALQQQEIDIFYDVRSTKNFLQKYGLFLLFAGVVIFIMFMWGTSI